MGNVQKYSNCNVISSMYRISSKYIFWKKTNLQNHNANNAITKCNWTCNDCRRRNCIAWTSVLYIWNSYILCHSTPQCVRILRRIHHRKNLWNEYRSKANIINRSRLSECRTWHKLGKHPFPSPS